MKNVSKMKLINIHDKKNVFEYILNSKKKNVIISTGKNTWQSVNF